MKKLETERLILGEYTINDFEAVHNYASSSENTVFMSWGPNSEEETREFLNNAIKAADNDTNNTDSQKEYLYAVRLKESGKLIGGCDISVKKDEASLGWILHRDYWKQGYGTEIGRALLRFGFDDLHLRRIIALCDAENSGSCRIMEKIGMRREGLFLEHREPHKKSDGKYGDELLYAIVKSEWETLAEIEYYNASPCVFDGFMDLPELSDGVIHLVCMAKNSAIPEKKWVPSYDFAICLGSEKIGSIDLRIGYTGGLYYGGQIGYTIDEKNRGNGYAVCACRALQPVAKFHAMTRLLITNNHINTASKRVCEKLGARFIRTARLPPWHDLYLAGQRFENIFEWNI